MDVLEELLERSDLVLCERPALVEMRQNVQRRLFFQRGRSLHLPVEVSRVDIVETIGDVAHQPSEGTLTTVFAHRSASGKQSPRVPRSHEPRSYWTVLPTFNTSSRVAELLLFLGTCMHAMHVERRGHVGCRGAAREQAVHSSVPS